MSGGDEYTEVIFLQFGRGYVDNILVVYLIGILFILNTESVTLCTKHASLADVGYDVTDSCSYPPTEYAKSP